jgi:ABC-type uncharacterized transport system YnjBCD permease subunit
VVAYACEQDMWWCIFIKEFEDFVMEMFVIVCHSLKFLDKGDNLDKKVIQ